LRFDSVVFADSASLAALSCFSRLKAERRAGRRSLVVARVDVAGASVIEAEGLATVRAVEDLETGGEAGKQPWRERVALVIRGFDPKHVMAPLGLLGVPPSGLDYFNTLRAALSVERGRDLFFFEERPHCLVPESLPLRLAGLGARLPPAIRVRSPRGYATFALRLVTGAGVPPIFGGLRDRWRLSRSLKTAFQEAADWDPQRALGPKLQPVLEPWTDGDSTELFALAAQLGQEAGLGSKKAFRRRMSRQAAATGNRTPIERYWLSLPGPAESDSMND
jgi:hypothetical protein